MPAQSRTLRPGSRSPAGNPRLVSGRTTRTTARSSSPTTLPWAMRARSRPVHDRASALDSTAGPSSVAAVSAGTSSLAPLCRPRVRRAPALVTSASPGGCVRAARYCDQSRQVLRVQRVAVVMCRPVISARTGVAIGRMRTAGKLADLSQALTGRFTDHHAMLCRLHLDRIALFGTAVGAEHLSESRPVPA